mmetsp:Transcript_26573/g.63289  ORF Transcript_26573/g.63289 Transcript_26573/m.63289 type:complete len:94 (-) Transcript_26573:3332-3613(-)
MSLQDEGGTSDNCWGRFGYGGAVGVGNANVDDRHNTAVVLASPDDEPFKRDIVRLIASELNSLSTEVCPGRQGQYQYSQMTKPISNRISNSDQ